MEDKEKTQTMVVTIETSLSVAEIIAEMEKLADNGKIIDYDIKPQADGY